MGLGTLKGPWVQCHWFRLQGHVARCAWPSLLPFTKRLRDPYGTLTGLLTISLANHFGEVAVRGGGTPQTIDSSATFEEWGGISKGNYEPLK